MAEDRFIYSIDPGLDIDDITARSCGVTQLIYIDVDWWSDIHTYLSARQVGLFLLLVIVG